jgi:hypothetical protein
MTEQEIKQKISNLCGEVGNQEFIIRQAKADTQNFFAQIDSLRIQLKSLLEQNSGSKETK